jgi:hypothetical protein
MMRIITRLLSLSSSEEDVFWVLSGLIRNFPRPFCVNNSMMIEDCKSVMRYEIIAFKALVKSRLPAVSEKFNQFGIPLELCVYNSFLSFWADFFPSEHVLRMWDIQFFHFSLKDRSERKRGVWYLLAPAYLILRDRE